MSKEKETEDKIFNAARKVFQERGFAGARMQEIADEAGINKSMLHYYFRSKDKLFHQVFQISVKNVLPGLFSIIGGEASLQEKTSMVVSFYTDILRGNPHLPIFVLHEMHQNPERFKEFMGEMQPEIPQNFLNQVQESVDNGEIRPISPANFLINLLSLCMFPFIAKNMITTVLKLDDQAYSQMLTEREELIPDLIFNGLTPKNGDE